MMDEKNNRLMWGVMLLVGALGCASMRNNPVLGISPLMIGIIEGVIYICIMSAVRVSGWRMAALIALITPVYLWMQRFLDGFMIPVEMAVNLTLIGCMGLILKSENKNYWINTAVLAIPAFAVLLLAATVAISVVKDEGIIRALILAWNTDFYSGISILGASMICTPFSKKEAR